MKAINGYFVIDEAYLDYGMAYEIACLKGYVDYS
jgi:histidinol-phosphate/aromatic aminotransferase/cobyric acid decarboxylase-like protein